MSYEFFGELARKELKEILKEALREEFGIMLSRKESERIQCNDSDRKSYFTVREAAKISGLGASTVRLAIRKRELRALHVGRRVLIKKDDLATYLEASPIQLG